MHLKFLRTKFRAHVAPRLRQASNACNETSKTSSELYRVQCAFKTSNCSKHERDPSRVNILHMKGVKTLMWGIDLAQMC